MRKTIPLTILLLTATMRPGHVSAARFNAQREEI